MPFLLAAALMFVLFSAAASAVLLLPVVVAAESLHNAPLRRVRRFWLVATVLPVALGAVATLAACAVLGGDIAANPHHAELATRAHLCLARLTGAPDAIFRFRLYGLMALGLVLFAVVRLGWGLHSSLRAQRLADRFATDELAGNVLTVDAPEADCFSIGLDRPLIVMTEGLRQALAPEEVAAVLAHEEGHARHLDLPAELLLRAVTDPLIWLPSSHYLLHMARAAIEQRCDEEAAAATSAAALSGALQKMARITQARQVQLQGDLAPLRPTFPAYSNPRARLAALMRDGEMSLALPLPVILGVEAALLLAAVAWLAQPLHDTLYCVARSLQDVMKL